MVALWGGVAARSAILGRMTPRRELALRLAEGRPARPKEIDRVAAQTSVEDAIWAFSQWDLRRRARAKFAAAADAMLFDRDGLEMASHEALAAHHASRFPTGATVADLTCGIGADLIAFARRGPALGFEIDPERADYARHNLRVAGVMATVETQDGLEAAALDYAFCDPSRRAEGKRIANMVDYHPDPHRVAERFRQARLLGFKLSPMAADRDLESLGGRLEFASYGGECREALAWIGPEAPPGRFAVHVESGETIPAGSDPPATDQPGRFILEADPAAIRAHCLGELSEAFGLRALGDSHGYLTGDHAPATPWLSPYEVLACHPADLKRTRMALRELGGGTPIVKSRAPRVDVAELRAQLQGPGDPLVVLVFPVGKRRFHALARPLLGGFRRGLMSRGRVR